MAGEATDRVLRAMTNDGGFRVIAANTTETVQGAVAAQGVQGSVAARFGELLTGAVLYRETMAPQLRVQAILKGTGDAGQIVVDSKPDGATRGLVRPPKDGSELRVGGGALLQMMRTMPRGDLHRGVVEVPDEGGISGGLMTYMQASEQVVSMISVGCKHEGDAIVAAGGYIVQLLPELSEGELMVMTERLKDFRKIEDLFDSFAESPERLISEILFGMEHTMLDSSEVRFECGCSELRVMTSLATLGRSDLEELMAPGETLEISCDYCGKEYKLSPEQLRGLLDGS